MGCVSLLPLMILVGDMGRTAGVMACGVSESTRNSGGSCGEGIGEDVLKARGALE